MWVVDLSPASGVKIWPLCEFLMKRLGPGYGVDMASARIWKPRRWIADLFNLPTEFESCVAAVTQYGLLRVNVDVVETPIGSVLRVWPGYVWNTVPGMLLNVLFPLKWLLALMCLPLLNHVLKTMAPTEWTDETQQAFAGLTGSSNARPFACRGTEAARRLRGGAWAVVPAVVKIVLGFVLLVVGAMQLVQRWHWVWQYPDSDAYFEMGLASLAVGLGMRWLYVGGFTLCRREPSGWISLAVLLAGTASAWLIIGPLIGGAATRGTEASSFQRLQARPTREAISAYWSVPGPFRRIEAYPLMLDAKAGYPTEDLYSQIYKDLTRYHADKPGAEEIRKRIEERRGR